MKKLMHKNLMHEINVTPEEDLLRCSMPARRDCGTQVG
jgi:hypothetical protein